MRPSFLDEAFFSGLGSSNLPIEDAESLPPLCYTDGGFYEFEKEAVFNHEWLCVGRDDQIPNAGDYLAVTVASEPLLVVQGLSRSFGGLHATPFVPSSSDDLERRDA